MESNIVALSVKAVSVGANPAEAIARLTPDQRTFSPPCRAIIPNSGSGHVCNGPVSRLFSYLCGAGYYLLYPRTFIFLAAVAAR